jgi:hypothetical protein
VVSRSIPCEISYGADRRGAQPGEPVDAVNAGRGGSPHLGPRSFHCDE